VEQGVVPHESAPEALPRRRLTAAAFEHNIFITLVDEP
jgi:hypothetical protein